MDPRRLKEGFPPPALFPLHTAVKDPERGPVTPVKETARGEVRVMEPERLSAGERVISSRPVAERQRFSVRAPGDGAGGGGGGGGEGPEAGASGPEVGKAGGLLKSSARDMCRFTAGWEGTEGGRFSLGLSSLSRTESLVCGLLTCDSLLPRWLPVFGAWLLLLLMTWMLARLGRSGMRLRRSARVSDSTRQEDSLETNRELCEKCWGSKGR